MPTYHARNITVRLGSVPLSETITGDIVLRKGEKAKQQSELAEKKLLQSLYLQEKRLQFPGATDDFELNWLGNAPFMQVEADNGTALPSKLTGSAVQDRAAQALALHVEFSDKTFHSGFTGKTHLKTEVLFNGQLSACSLTHTNDIRSGAKPLHQIFAGYRVDFLAERPWVLLPSFMTADGGTRRFHKTMTPLERFNEISAALHKEAEERGTDNHGAPPPSARFIDALASLQAPASVANLQKPGGKKFGVVDVIITAGTGNKPTTGVNYLKRPQRLKDSDYAVRTEIESEVESNINTAAADLGETRRKVGGLPQQLDRVYVKMEERIDDLDDRPCKRRALPLTEGQSQYTAQDMFSQAPLLGTHDPVLSTPNGTTLQCRVSPNAGKITSSCTSPEYCTDGHRESLPCSDREYGYRTACETMQDYSSTSSQGIQQYQSPPAVLYSSTPQPVPMFPRSAGMPCSDSMTRHRTLNAWTFPRSAPGTARGHIEDSLSFSQPMWSGGNDPSALVGSSATPIAWMLPTSTSWPSSPITMSSPRSGPTYVPTRVHSKTFPPSSSPTHPSNMLPNLGPQMPFFYGQMGCAPLATQPMSSSPVIQMGGPLPPTAMFSVPSKPRGNASPSKGVAVAEPAKSSTGVLVRRLVIVGLNGRLIVDHRWKIGRYVVGNRCLAMGVPQNPASAPICEHEGPKDDSHPQQQSQTRVRSVKSRPCAPPPTKAMKSESIQQSMREQQRDSLQDGQADPLTTLLLPYLKRHQGPLSKVPATNSQIDMPDDIALFVPTPMLTTVPNTQMPRQMQTPSSALPTAPISSPRRTLQRHALPSIQGPKAAMFLYDDPEEVLRESTRIRRCRSPTKQSTNARASSKASPVPPSTTADHDGLGDSSPLSSVPSSPLPDLKSEAAETVALTPNNVPQLDGFSEAALPTVSPRSRSPQKLIVSTPRLQRPAPATPQSSISPDSKKRKLANRWPVKVPRSPDRLKTVSNPPLNDDCVIAFAESTDKNEKRGVLRQVRGERQGVFKEDYVVLAVRFYIAGG